MLNNTFKDSIYREKLTGEYFHGLPVGLVAAQRATVASTLYVMPFWVEEGFSIDRIAINVKAASAGHIARVGVYKDNGSLYPGELVVDGGTISVNAIAVVAATVAVTLPQGWCWTAVVSDGIPQLLLTYPTFSPLGIESTGLSPGTGEYSGYSKAAVGTAALADPCVSGAALAKIYNYIVAVRKA